MIEPRTRASLLVRVRQRDDVHAWKQFVELYGPMVYGYARGQGLQDADAADLSQDVLTAVAGAIGRLDYDPAKGSFRGWLFTIVRRRLCDWRALRAKRAQGSGDTGVQQLLEQLPRPDTDEAEWQASWKRHVFSRACEVVRGEVTEPTWLAFWRSAVEGQAGNDVAAGLGLTISAVYNARSRVLQRLKAVIRAVQESEGD